MVSSQPEHIPGTSLPPKGGAKVPKAKAAGRTAKAAPGSAAASAPPPSTGDSDEVGLGKLSAVYAHILVQIETAIGRIK